MKEKFRELFSQPEEFFEDLKNFLINYPIYSWIHAIDMSLFDEAGLILKKLALHQKESIAKQKVFFIYL